MTCDQEMCPMWDGDGCPCDRFGFDRDNLPTDGVFTVATDDGIYDPDCTCGLPIGHMGECR